MPFRILFACLLLLAPAPAMAGEDVGDRTPEQFAADNGITWPMPLPTAGERAEAVATFLKNNMLEFYNAEGFDEATCHALLARVAKGDISYHEPVATAPDIDTLREKAGISQCAQNDPLLNPGREWTILTKYYRDVVAIPDWRDWPHDKSTLYEAQYNLVLFSPYPENAAGKGTDLLFYGEGICRPSDRYICLNPRYKLFDPTSCGFKFNFMVDARYTPRSTKLRTEHDGVLETANDVFIYDIVADSGPDEATARNGRFRLREILTPEGKPSKRSCQFGTPDYVSVWKRFHKPK